MHWLKEQRRLLREKGAVYCWFVDTEDRLAWASILLVVLQALALVMLLACLLRR